MGKYDSRRIVHVQPIQGLNIRYGFATNIDQAQSSQLGHVALAGTPPNGYVFGANAPKPARASRRFATGMVSSFVSVTSIVAARGQGWKVGLAKRGGPVNTAKSQTVFVTMNGVKYAWNQPKDTQQKIGGLGALGIRVATTADRDLVFGASRPRPPRARRIVGTGDQTDVISTFYDPTVAQLPAGWSDVSRGVDPLQG